MLAINTIYNDDCLNGIKELPDNSVNLILTDPPYFLGMTANGQKGTFTDLAICRPFYENLFTEYRRVLKDDGFIFFFTDWRGYAFYYQVFDNIIGASNLLVWDKGSGPGNKYNFQHELMIFHAPASASIGGSSIWRIPGFSAGAKKIEGPKLHPTQKPIDLFTKIVTDHTKPGDLVLDTFMGAATTAVVCKRTGRNFIGWEIDKERYKTAIKRISDI